MWNASGVECRKSIVTGLLIKNGILQGVETAQGSYRAPKVIIATGGMSYPRTGSTGDGYAFARRVGHTITPISGSLVPLEIVGGECRKLQGLTLRNIGLKLWGKGKKPVYEDQGELLFMPYGLSGPIILSASAHMDEKKGPYHHELDLKPRWMRKSWMHEFCGILPKSRTRVSMRVSGGSYPKTWCR